MLWAILGAAAAIAAILYLRNRRRRKPRIISFVALLREPVLLEAAVLARLAAR